MGEQEEAKRPEEPLRVLQFRDTSTWQRRTRVAAAVLDLSLAKFIRRAVHNEIMAIEEKYGVSVPAVSRVGNAVPDESPDTLLR